MNLMTINIASCLTLFPAVLWDLNLVKSSLTPSIVKNDASMMTSSYGSPISVCIWSTLSSSLVAHTSLLAMLTIGKLFCITLTFYLFFAKKNFCCTTKQNTIVASNFWDWKEKRKIASLYLCEVVSKRRLTIYPRSRGKDEFWKFGVGWVRWVELWNLGVGWVKWSIRFNTTSYVMLY